MPLSTAAKRTKKAEDMVDASGLGKAPPMREWIDKTSTPSISTSTPVEGGLLTAPEAPHLVISVNVNFNVPNLEEAIRRCLVAVAAAGKCLRPDLVTR